MKCELKDPVILDCCNDFIDLHKIFIDRFLIDRSEPLGHFLYSQLHKIEPKIKGKLTKDKLKRRGIKFVVRIDYRTTSYWIEQRGIVISDIIQFTNEISFS